MITPRARRRLARTLIAPLVITPLALGVGEGGRVLLLRAHARLGGRRGLGCGRRGAELLRPAPLALGGRQRGVLAQPPAGARVVLVQLVQARGALHLGGRVDTHLGRGRGRGRGRG